jgi:hypothetical protein
MLTSRAPNGLVRIGLRDWLVRDDAGTLSPASCMKTPAFARASTLALTLLLQVSIAAAQVDPKPFAIEFEQTVLRPM